MSIVLVIIGLAMQLGIDNTNTVGTASAMEPFIPTPKENSAFDWENGNGDSHSVSGTVVAQNATTAMNATVQRNQTPAWFYENPKSQKGLFFETKGYGFNYGNWSTVSHNSDSDISVFMPSTEGREEIVPTGGPAESDLAVATKTVPRSAPANTQDEAAEIESLRNFDTCVRMVNGVAKVGIAANGHSVPTKVLPDEVVPN